MSVPAPVFSTNRFEVFVGSAAFEEALTAAIERCQQRVYSQFMTFEGDPSGMGFAHLIRQKSQAGIDVRLMVDYYSDVVLSDTYPILLHRRGKVQAERDQTLGLLADLEKNGVKVKRTAPPGRFFQYMLYRNHKKMIIIDETTAFVGGINISDHNYHWHDFMVKIEGPLVRDLLEDFCSTWHGTTTAFATPCPDEDFILNQCAGRYSIFEEILAMIRRAEQSIVIESPYLVGDHIESALRTAAERGIKIQIIMPYHSNKLMYRLWVRKTKQVLNHPNITVYGFRGANDIGMTHAKLVMVDGKWATFGSLNIMELEGLTQKELNIFTSNPDCIRDLQKFIDDDLQQSVALKIPRYSFGRFTYTLAYRFFQWWTPRLLRQESWRKLYL